MVAKRLLAILLAACLISSEAGAWVLNNHTEYAIPSPSGVGANTTTLTVAHNADLVLLAVLAGCVDSGCSGLFSTAFDLSSASIGSTTCSHVVHSTIGGGNNARGATLWKCENVAAGASQTVSITLNQSTYYVSAEITDWSGAAVSNTSEGANSVSDANVPSASPGSITTGTITKGDLVYSGVGTSGGVFTVGGCCTVGASASNWDEYQIATSTSATNTWTFTGGSQLLDMVIAGFKPLPCVSGSLATMGVGGC